MRIQTHLDIEAINFLPRISKSVSHKMSSISSMRNISKRCLCSNFAVESSLPSLQWRFYTRARSSQQFTKTRNLRVSPFLYTPFPSHSFSTLNSKKVGFIGWYLGKLDSRPILTKTVTTSLIYAAADLTAQVKQKT